MVEAYNFLSLNYEGFRANDDSDLPTKSADEIFLFGFSRGAYTVRALSGLISTIGILKKNSMAYFPALYAAYQSQSHKDDKQVSKEDVVQQVREHHPDSILDFEAVSAEVKIKVIGCWDTVGSLGIPDAWFVTREIRTLLNRDLPFSDPRLSTCKLSAASLRVKLKLICQMTTGVENAFQALALDEHRRAFSPTLWHMPSLPVSAQHVSICMTGPLISNCFKAGATPPNLVQCWFPGVHINTGGGWRDEKTGYKAHTDLGELANITFMWMVELCLPFLLFNQKFIDAFREEHHTKLSQPNVLGWAQGQIADSCLGSTAAAGSRTRAPGQYDTLNQITTDQKEIDAAQPTFEYIHPSVRIRMQKRGKQVFSGDTDQLALAGFRMIKEVGNAKNSRESGLVWRKEVKGLSITIPEWKMNLAPNGLERGLVEAEDILRDIQQPEPFTLPPAPSPPSFPARAYHTIVRTITGFLPR